MDKIQRGHKIFVAGSTGAVGRIMCRMLAEQEHQVFGLTRRAEKSDFLKSIGTTPVVGDVYDADKMTSLFKSIQPDVVIHQLTDLPYGLPSEKMEAARAANDRIRDLGTRNLVHACRGSRVTRFIVQSIAFMYREGSVPHSEKDPLASESLKDFEHQVLEGDFEGIVLRYGKFYGPHTGFDAPDGACRLHVEDAARAAVLAVSKGSGGVYNIAEDEAVVSSRKAFRELGWKPDLRSGMN